MGRPDSAGRDIIEYEEARYIIDKAKSLRDKALFSMLYLLGCRISELTNHYESIMKDIPGKKDRKQVRGKEHVIPGIKKRNINILEDEIQFLVPTHKKRKPKKKKMIRDDPVRNLVIGRNSPFIDIIIEYLNTKEENDVLFPITTCWAWKLLKGCKEDVWLHLFRHSRLSKLATITTSPYDLLNWSGHSDFRQLKPYLQLMPVRSFKGGIK